ncbi:MAG: glycosyltransferase family 4 protein [Bacteroidota bacterium]
MKIALITDGIWPYVMGGMQKHSYYLCKYLAQNKVNVDLIHFNRSKLDITDLSVFSEEEKKYIHSIIVDFPGAGWFPGHYLKASYIHSKIIFETIKDQIHTYDFIYTKGFTGWYLMEQKAAKKINCAKIGVKFHGYEMFQKAPNYKILLQQRFLLRKPVVRLSKMADVVFSYGGKITDIIKEIGVDEQKIVVLPSGVEQDLLAPGIKATQKPIRFLYLGRYERRKGIEEINAAILKLGEGFSNFANFNFIGNIPQNKRLNLQHIHYHGEVRDKSILKDLIKQNDVLLCPSYSEGMPNVILEAMANGLTVIATDVGATNVLVNNQNGFLLQVGNSQQLIQTIKEICSLKPIDIDIKKTKSLELIKKDFVWQHLSEKLLKEIRKQV